MSGPVVTPVSTVSSSTSTDRGPGYHVDYVTALTADGSGDPVPVEGGAILRVIARSPAYDNHGSATVDPEVVDATDVSSHPTFRDVAWAGSFEGQTTLGLGVRARLPFRVFTLDGPRRRLTAGYRRGPQLEHPAHRPMTSTPAARVTNSACSESNTTTC